MGGGHQEGDVRPAGGSQISVINLNAKQAAMHYRIFFQAIIDDLEKSKQTDKANQEAIVSKLMRKKSRRETQAIWSEIRNGVLRRSNSEEEIGVNVHNLNCRETTGSRVRHSSEGKYDDVNISGRWELGATGPAAPGDDETGTDNVYENVTFFQGFAKFGDKRKDDAIEMNSCHNYNSDIHEFISHHSSR